MIWRFITLHSLIKMWALDQLKLLNAREVDQGQDVVEFIKPK
jgi:hypothetical protein